MRIVVTDTELFPADARRRLERLGDVQVYGDRPESPEAFLARVDRAEVAIVTHFRLQAEIFRDTTLKLISLARTGYDDIDLDAAVEAGVAVANAPGYADEAVAEQVFAMLLAFLRKIREADQSVREGCFECRSFEGRELAGRTLGILGLGRIGRRVAEIARCFGMRVLAYDARIPAYDEGEVSYVGLEQLYRSSDFISVHLPLTPATTGLVGKAAFGLMKPSAVFVNTARGRIVDEAALLCALEGGLIAGACLDVFEVEPPLESPLLRLDNVLLTPHSAYNTVEAKRKAIEVAVGNVEAFLAGHPRNIVTPLSLCPP